MREFPRARPTVSSITSALSHCPEIGPCKGGKKCLAQEAEEVRFGEDTTISAILWTHTDSAFPSVLVTWYGCVCFPAT